MDCLKTKRPSSTKTSSQIAISPFIAKTFTLLEEKKYPEVIDWNLEGTAIIIKDPADFALKVLPLYFKHNNLTSFVRQLNMYDFRKCRTKRYDHVYCHDLFQRRKANLLPKITRKKKESESVAMRETLSILQQGQLKKCPKEKMEAMEEQLLKKLNRDTQSQIAGLEDQVGKLALQNKEFCDKIIHQKQKEDLLVFLISKFMKNDGVTLDQLPKVLNNQIHEPIIEFSPSFADQGENSNHIQEPSAATTDFEIKKTDSSDKTNSFSSRSLDQSESVDSSQINSIEEENFIQGCSGSQNILGKRSPVGQGDNFMETQKLHKYRCFQNHTQDVVSFSQSRIDNDNFSDIKARKNANFIDLCFNYDN